MVVNQISRCKISEVEESLRDDIVSVVNNNPTIFNGITPDTEVIVGISVEDFPHIEIFIPDKNGEYKVIIRY